LRVTSGQRLDNKQATSSPMKGEETQQRKSIMRKTERLLWPARSVKPKEIMPPIMTAITATVRKKPGGVFIFDVVILIFNNVIYDIWEIFPVLGGKSKGICSALSRR
jgi:hypothetical protein